MKWNQVKRDWLSVSQQVKLKWGKFTDEDLALISGQRDSFVRLLGQRYGDAQSVAEKKVDAFIQGLNPPSERSKILAWPKRCWESIRNYRYAKPRI